MRRLFAKIFLWFWATVIGSAIALALTFRLGPEAVPTRYHIAWGFALLVSGGICYLLTRYLTSPVLRLQAAARLLAEGELRARATAIKPRRDEIGDLVRDFNFMASRIEELVTSQRQLISDISHELRSPLARVNATLGLVRQRFGPNALFDRMERDTERLNEMIGRLLTLARLDATPLPAEKRRIDVNALLSEIVADVQWEASERDCRVHLLAMDLARYTQMQTCYAARWRMSSETASGIRHATRRSRSDWSAQERVIWLPSYESVIAGLAFPPRTWRTSSVPSTASTKRATGRRAASASGWPLRSVSRAFMVEAFTLRIEPAADWRSC